MSDHAAAWVTALGKYVSTVHFGGTSDERAKAWARANKALDKALAHEQAEVRRRFKRDTEELEAV